jgi:hypothetical protein
VKRHVSLRFICAAACLAASAAMAAQTADPGPRAQADAFCASAAAHIRSGSLETARAMIGSALELFPGSSEALFLRAGLELANRGETRAGIADARAALAAGSWGATDPSMASQLLAAALWRTNAYREALAVAIPLTEQRPDDPASLLVLCRAQAGAGETAAALRSLDEGVRRFPLVDDFRLLSAAVLERQGKRAAARDQVSTGLKVHPDSLPLLLAAARLQTGAAARAAAAALYETKGGTDPLAAVIGMEAASKPDERAKQLGLFLAMQGLARQDLVSRAVAAAKGDPQASAALAKALAEWSGTRDLDADGDGFWEERWTFQSGRPVAWTREPAEDGVAQFSAAFDGGSAASFTWWTAQGTRVTLRYSRYPSVQAAEIAGQGTLSLVPYSLECAFLAAAPPARGESPRIAARISPPGIDELTRAAYRRDERAADGVTRLRTQELSGGKLVWLEEDANGDGLIDHRVWYVDGAPDRGERSLGAPGTFPVKERWRGGLIVSEETDTDGDGRVDFRQTYGERPTRSWDYNEDGRDDCRERSEGGAVVREMSTRLDGAFDLQMTFEGGRLTRILRSGARVPVTADQRRGVTWIGDPSAAAPDLSAPDGIQALPDGSYLVFRRDGIVYAEAVR